MGPGCVLLQLVKWGLMALPSPQRERSSLCGGEHLEDDVTLS